MPNICLQCGSDLDDHDPLTHYNSMLRDSIIVSEALALGRCPCGQAFIFHDEQKHKDLMWLNDCDPSQRAEAIAQGA